jgi:endoglucanase
MVNMSAPGTDVAALTSSALSSASYLFRYKYNDTKYADKLLKHATDLFHFAETAKPWQPYSMAVPAVKGLYATNRYQNQLLLGCLWMYKVTGNETYYNKIDAYTYLFRDNLYPSIMDWSDQTGAALVLGASLNDTDLKFRNMSLNYFNTILDTIREDSICTYTNGGLFWCDGSSDANSVSPPLNTALLIALFQQSYTDLPSNYTSFMKNQLDYILGNNKM